MLHQAGALAFCYCMYFFTELESKFDQSLHGQHLIREKVIRSLRGHLEDPNPSKALVLSFHGWNGVGKNFVSHMMVENLYKNGYRSQYVKMFIPANHFRKKELVPQYEVRASCYCCWRPE